MIMKENKFEDFIFADENTIVSVSLKDEDNDLNKSSKKALKGVTKDQSLIDNDVILSVRHLKKFFSLGSGVSKAKLKAVHDVSFDVKKGEVFGLVGESGCGKTTTGRCIIKLHDITSGSIYFKGYRISAGSRWNEKEIKWTKVRGKNRIKELESERKSVISEMSNASKADQELIDKVNKEYQGKINEIKTRIQSVEKVQKEKIKQHKYDEDHVDKNLLTKIQMIFQDPIDSLDPRMTVEDIIEEGLKIQRYEQVETKKIKAFWDQDIEKVRNMDISEEEKSELIQHVNKHYSAKVDDAKNYHKKVADVLLKVGLIPEYASRYPHEFSGGQRQRIGIARAIVMKPELIIADEPISALDVSIRAQIINLLNDLREEMGLTIVFIAHDLSVVKYFCDRIAVMYFGVIVETATSDELFRHPLHPYTKSLLSAIPRPDPLTEKKRKRIKYNPDTAHDYSKEKPWMQEIEPGHFILANTEEMKKYKEEIKHDYDFNKLIENDETVENPDVLPPKKWKVDEIEHRDEKNEFDTEIKEENKPVKLRKSRTKKEGKSSTSKQKSKKE